MKAPAAGRPDPTDPLVLEDVGYRIRSGRWLLQDVSLRFAAGTLTALVGPNGAGKSTLLGLMAGDLEPGQGRVLVDGRTPRAWRARELARRRAVLPQEHAVRFAFSVEEVVAMGRMPHPPDPPRDAGIVADALQTADLAGMARRDVQSLSGGEAARTGFARVLAQRTPILLLDEPTAALDLRHQERTLRHARSLADAGACVVVVLHDLNLAAAHSGRVVILDRGRVAADGPPRAVITREVIEAVYRQPVRVIDHPVRDAPLVVMAD